MTRLSLVLVALVGILAGALASLTIRPASPVLDAKTINPMIEAYLLDNPGIMERVNARLETMKVAEQRAAQKAAIDKHYAEIYQQPGTIVLGNPKGDVTLVEMFDYNCSYCRRALPDLATLIAEDPNLKVILKEFPILTAGSVDAARIAVLVADNPKIDYWDFHQKLFATRGEVGAQQALAAAEAVGGDRVSMMLDMNGKRPAEVIKQTYDLAKALGISGTPTYILGDELIPGALPIDQLRAKISNLRACGSTVCAAEAAPAG